MRETEDDGNAAILFFFASRLDRTANSPYF